MPEKYMGEKLLHANVFDENFAPLSYLADDANRLQAIELALKAKGGSYVIAMETFGVHMARVEMEDADVTQDGDAQSYVISSDEILPSDLLNLKNRPFDELRPFLLQQDGED